MTNKFWMAAAVTLLATACGSPPTVTGGASPSSVATPSASTASPTATPAPPARLLALVTLKGSNQVVVRDITDIGHPRSIGSFGSITTPVFVSATELSYATTTGMYRVPFSGSPKTQITQESAGGTWSPDGSAVLYVSSVSPESVTVHQLRGGHDQVIGTVPGGGGGGCESVGGCAIANSLDFRLLYSPDGTLISLVTSGFGSSSFRVWSADGVVVSSNDTGGSTMSAWSGSGLYFRDGKGVEVWRDGTASPFLPGVMWIRPSASSAGGQVVYTVRGSGGWGHIFVVDTTTRKVRELKSARTDAVFLTPRFVWYKGERACVEADQCGANPPWHPESGKSYIYDLQTGTETESIITGVFDVWPHAA